MEISVECSIQPHNFRLSFDPVEDTQAEVNIMIMIASGKLVVRAHGFMIASQLAICQVGPAKLW